MDEVIENRIAGWMQRAVEISGCRHVAVKTDKSLTKQESYTEFKVSWK
jgi:hypothetical protein